MLSKINENLYLENTDRNLIYYLKLSSYRLKFFSIIITLILSATIGLIISIISQFYHWWSGYGIVSVLIVVVFYTNWSIEKYFKPRHFIINKANDSFLFYGQTAKLSEIKGIKLINYKEDYCLAVELFNKNLIYGPKTHSPSQIRIFQNIADSLYREIQNRLRST